MNTKWHISVPEDVDRSVRTYLAGRGLKKGDLSRFVSEAVSREVLRATLRDVQERNADLSEDEAMALAREAVAWARATPS